ncbi:tryptophan transporter [Bacillus coahuilensis p1.1.43]|uniref:Tryptophan transporter n=1 Tax=Bacillus coahuilensis p1.1.43 TaxID=1150625 RepID=A0A147KAY7_9BACI|nr:tryptophan transporter [Bacillus coahuilensis]KUP07951.1 tryptophan transporter [Bacillus coahuilensis p1.1.43]
MNTKTMVTLSLFVGIGAILHAVIPGIGDGMKPDMMLVMMFLGIITFPTIKNALTIGVVAGLISGITTTFPGGFFPNVIDKPLTALLFFGLLILAKRFIPVFPLSVGLTAIGTLISGTIFLTSALIIVGLPVPFTVLLIGVVLPAIVLNGIAMFILYPIVQTILKRTSLIDEAAA